MLIRRRGVAQFGSALEWGSRGRKFDSCHSDHFLLTFAFLQAFFTGFFSEKNVLSSLYFGLNARFLRRKIL